MESIRQSLDVNLKSTFQQIDRHNEGFLRAFALRDYLADCGFFATDKELLGLLSRFDPECKARISFEQFQEMLTPKLH